MIDQHDKKLRKDVQKSGCLFLSLLFIAQMEAKKVLTTGDVNNLYDICTEKLYMEKDCSCKNPDGVLRAALAYLSCDKKIHQTGSIQQGEEPTYWGWVDDKNEGWDWLTLKIKTSGHYGTHFVIADEDNGIIYDPMYGKGYTRVSDDVKIIYKVFDN
jgi:hypothetical protein